MRTAWKRKVLILCGSALSIFPLVGCSSSIVDQWSNPLEKPKASYQYLPVHDMPPDHDEPLVSPDQRSKVEPELVAARRPAGVLDGRSKFKMRWV
jgi:hypothetical protein